ncbi:unnamed protein product [Amoebophrya sp. A25]|nr:unnamed protein product [Amoebophrya sp. A25]|eukprot:GSA25T00013421001.1
MSDENAQHPPDSQLTGESNVQHAIAVTDGGGPIFMTTTCP